MSLYTLSVGLMKPKLTHLKQWLGEARTYAEQRSFDADGLLQARLAPDQFPFVRQVQAVTDTAKLTAARLAVSEAPKHADDETTMSELEARIDSVCSYLDTLPEADFDGSRPIHPPFAKDYVMEAADYVHEFALPNFFFHLTHAYAILRHNGVPLGKRAFLGSVTLRPKDA
ncbi:MAG: DUF1993 domain-containing protein [Myxococcota bacterium]